MSGILRDRHRSSPFGHVRAEARAPLRGGPEAGVSLQRPVKELLLYVTTDRGHCWFLRWKDEELSDDDRQANCGDHLDDEGASSDG